MNKNQNIASQSISINCPVCAIGVVEGYISSYYDKGMEHSYVELSCSHCAQSFSA